MGKTVQVFLGEAIAEYGFGDGHPFNTQRMSAFETAFYQQQLDKKVSLCPPQMASDEVLAYFHTLDYIEQVKRQSKTGEGYLDYGDTPAFHGVYEAAAHVVGSSVQAAINILSGDTTHAFVPIAGLHHARRDRASGFCVFNDCGVVIEALRKKGLNRIVYVDIDAHHGDGVFYSFEDYPDVFIVDFHEDGRFLYPGTGSKEETGKGKAQGSKLNFPLPMQCNDELFLQLWPQAEDFIRQQQPEFIILQCGADSLAGDPITHLQLSEKAHAHTAQRLCVVAKEFNCGILAQGGGGYNLQNIATAWCAVVKELCEDYEKN